MAPTEILAEQHYREVLRSGSTPLGVEVAWLAGSLPAQGQTQALAALPPAERTSRSAPTRCFRTR